jgi:hypothetical protein
VNVRWFVVVRPNNEAKAVDKKDGWHSMIIPIRLGYSISCGKKQKFEIIFKEVKMDVKKGALRLP